MSIWGFVLQITNVIKISTMQGTTIALQKSRKISSRSNHGYYKTLMSLPSNHVEIGAVKRHFEQKKRNVRGPSFFLLRMSFYYSSCHFLTSIILLRNNATISEIKVVVLIVFLIFIFSLAIISMYIWATVFNRKRFETLRTTTNTNTRVT